MGEDISSYLCLCDGWRRYLAKPSSPHTSVLVGHGGRGPAQHRLAQPNITARPGPLCGGRCLIGTRKATGFRPRSTAAALRDLKLSSKVDTLGAPRPGAPGTRPPRLPSGPLVGDQPPRVRLPATARLRSAVRGPRPSWEASTLAELPTNGQEEFIYDEQSRRQDVARLARAIPDQSVCGPWAPG